MELGEKMRAKAITQKETRRQGDREKRQRRRKEGCAEVLRHFKGYFSVGFSSSPNVI
jgi:hypothetical protein